MTKTYRSAGKGTADLNKDAARLSKGQTEPAELGEDHFDRPSDLVIYDNVGGLFRLAFRKYQQLALARLEELGFGDIRLTHSQLIPFILLGATRTSEIAARASITKQSAGQLTDELEALGYIERIPDPDDGRAKILQFTERGKQMAQMAPEIIADSERALAQIVGNKAFAALKQTLKTMIASEPTTVHATKRNRKVR